MKKFTTVITASLIILAGVAAPALPVFARTPTEIAANVSAAEISTITLPVDTVVFGEPGSEYELGSRIIVNGQYKVQVEADSQIEEHPNADIIVRSGSSEVVVKDAARKSFGKKTADGTLNVIDNKAAAYVKLGSDAVYSGGIKVSLTPLEQPKPATPAPAQTPPAPTPAPTPAPAPSPAPAPQPAPAPAPAPAPTPAPPAAQNRPIPGAGPGDTAMIAGVSATVLGYAAYILRSRRLAAQTQK